MNDSYSQWNARNSAENLPLAARYQSADPITWNGSLVYPMYSERVGPEPILITMTLLSAAPPAGLHGHGIGLSVLNGYIGIGGRQLTGVDVWSDVLTASITFEVFPTDPNALFSLTPVWVDTYGIQKSWTGNYGILIEQPPTGRIILWCSIGEGPPNFANLVIEVDTVLVPPVPAVTAPYPSAAEPTPSPSLESTQPLAAANSDSAPDQSLRPTTSAQGPRPELPEFAHNPAPHESPRRAEHGMPSAPTASAPVAPAEHNRFQAQADCPPPPDPRGRHGAGAATPPLDEPRPTHLTDHTAPAAQLHFSNEPGPADHPGPVDQPSLVDQPTPTGQPRPYLQSAPPDADTGYRSALYDLGVAMFGRGEEEQACTLWAQAATAGHAGAAYDLGVVLFRRGDIPAAERWWRAAADLREPRAIAGLADLLERQGNSTEARIWRAHASDERATETGQPAGPGSGASTET